ncbi:Crp/Fnr family transcriptional regulator [Chitinophaga sp. GCM10012297]|uniref:Cyclic nucleotide-binding domain-containing protein n=1 Tax=Chitinophaga chungangae TaxID=2821488 RepID=A0ABS3YBR9_9BACT|nr:cyclic nucleotide-binding domain-containing protein [Chitinophaga chungangae]MBO9152114.1 cyclic nucleotide-binding domain-containing protein [Chitinophaga chungangae]
MGYLREYYDNIIRLQENEWQFIAAHFTRRTFRKGETIIAAGAREEYLSFIESGMVRFFVPGEENDLTFHFSFHKEFTCAYDSFLTRMPSEYTLQALSNLTLWSISHSDLQKVYAQTQAGNYLGRFAAEQLFLAKSRRELSLLKYTAKERYLQLFTEQPHILRQVPLKYVASYIGITPQGLSRIRKQIS